jgi:hypothetical protein
VSDIFSRPFYFLYDVIQEIALAQEYAMTKPTGRPRGRPKTKEYSTLMARVPQELVEQVQRYAALHQQSISVVIRDALEMLIEEERYQPFMSDRNGVVDSASDTNREREVPVKAQPAIMSDIIAADESQSEASEPAMLSDIKAGPSPRMAGAAQWEEKRQAEIARKLAEGYYVLGKCKNGHQWQDTGQAVLRNDDKRNCIECNRERNQERNKRMSQRQLAKTRAEGMR